MAVLPTQETVSFGLFELDLKAARLSRNGIRIRLAQQPLQLLSVLIESAGDVVTREQLRQRLWPSDVFIDFDHALNKSIQKLRDALSDLAESPRYIETIPRVGYRFISPVRSAARPSEPHSVLAIPQPPPPNPHPPALAAVAVSPAIRWRFFAAAGLTICAAIGVTVYLSLRTDPATLKYTQLTDFTDSATTPALSADGHFLAFIRGDSPFMSAGQIYVKMLPDGDARQLTNDPRLKYNLAFSPDGSQIAYTVLENGTFATYTISVLGGDPHLLLSNAAGLTWLDPNHFLFSRFRSGLHLGIVTEAATGDDLRELYFPPHQRAMAHYSLASPDHKSALVVEMNGQGEWTLCRLISIDGTAAPKPVGPDGACTAAAWSPDGSWMYFIATVEGQSHLWRQRYPIGRPEQLTLGPTEESGLAVEPDGRSVITSIGVPESSIWMHDATGERSLSSEGEVVWDASPPSFAPDDQTIYYLLRHRKAAAEPELWRFMVDTGKSEAVFPGTSMVDYNISPDGKQIVYTRIGRDGRSRIWLAPIDRSSAAREIGLAGETTPYFGPHGTILFLASEGNVNYLEQMNEDGSERSKVLPYPILQVQGISPGRKWLMAIAPYPEGNSMVPRVVAISLDGGSPRRICASYCVPAWSSNGRFLFIPVEDASQTTRGRTLAIPVGPGETLPALPPEGIPTFAEASVVPFTQSINRAQLVPGKGLSRYAYVNTAEHRNLYRITLR